VAQGHIQGKTPTLHGVQSELKKILAPQFMSSIFSVELRHRNNLPVLTYSVHHSAQGNLTTYRLGKSILITDHVTWSPAHIIQAYRNLSNIEATFKKIKDIRFLR
jgi:transposase